MEGTDTEREREREREFSFQQFVAVWRPNTSLRVCFVFVAAIPVLNNFRFASSCTLSLIVSRFVFPGFCLKVDVCEKSIVCIVCT